MTAVAHDLSSLARLAGRVERRVPDRLARLTDALRRVAPTPDQSLLEIREAYAAVAARTAVAGDVEVTTVDAGGVAADLLVPPEVADRTVLYLHGGAYTIGSRATVRPLAAQLAIATRSRVVSIDYRLAPEHPCPAARDDAVRAFGWVAEQVGDGALVVAGDSAGGGLAIATALALVRSGGRRPDAVLAMSPWTDLSADGPDAPCEDPQAPDWLLRRSAQAYGAGRSARDRAASPAYDDLRDLPPTLLQVGSAEPLLDDGLRFARAAFAAGAPLRLECWPGMLHVWHAFAPRLPEAVDALAAADAWLTAVLAGGADRAGGADPAGTRPIPS